MTTRRAQAGQDATPQLDEFLAQLAFDIEVTPSILQSPSIDLIQRIAGLVEGVEGDLNARLIADHE